MKIASCIDHTLLTQTAAEDDIYRLCSEAREYGFYSVMVNPAWVPTAVEFLDGSDVKVGTVVGFPLGANRPETKIEEALRAEADGVAEVDVVANIGWLQSGRFFDVSQELADIRSGLFPDTLVKVIIETPVLNTGFWKEAVEAVILSGAAFVKSATGFFGPTPVEHIERLKELTGDRIAIKAAGGIQTYESARAMLDAGATRLGCSASVAIVQSAESANM